MLTVSRIIWRQAYYYLVLNLLTSTSLSEIHIRLESLMASMLEQHSSLQHEYAYRPLCSKLSIPAPVINDEGKSLTPIPERIRRFSSQLASPPGKAIEKKNYPSTTESSKCNYHCDLEKYNNSKPNSIHKKYNVSPMTMAIKKRIIIKSRNSKDMLLRLFNNNPPTEENYAMKADDDIKFPANHKDDNEEEKILCNEYYTVSSPYSCIPSYFTPEEQSDKMDHISDNQKVEKHPISTDGDDNNDFSGKEEHVNSPKTHTPRLPNSGTSPHNWKYHTSNHVYAVKVVSEIMTPALREYSMWVTNVNANGSNLSTVYMPRLAIEWPKNWSYSQV